MTHDRRRAHRDVGVAVPGLALLASRASRASTRPSSRTGASSSTCRAGSTASRSTGRSTRLQHVASFRKWYEQTPGRLHLRRQGPALRHAHEEAQRRRHSPGQLLRLRRAGAGRQDRPVPVAAAAQPRLRRRPAGRVLRPAAPLHRRGGLARPPARRADEGPRADRPPTPTGRCATPSRSGTRASSPRPSPTCCASTAIALVIADTAGRWPLIREVTADLVYLRLHGDVELYTSGYTDEALDTWAAAIREWRARRSRRAGALRQRREGPRAVRRDLAGAARSGLLPSAGPGRMRIRRPNRRICIRARQLRREAVSPPTARSASCR